MEIIVFVFILGVTLVLAFVAMTFWFAAKRRQELSVWAAEHGYSFDPDQDSSMDDQYPAFHCLRQGDGRYAYNIMRGVNRPKGRSICVFDYHYETESTDSDGKSETDHSYFSAVIVETGLPLKPLAIRGETFFDKVGAFFGFEDINFESAEFSRQFHVTSPDRRWAFDVLPQPTMEFLLASPRFTMEIQNGCMMAYRSNTFSTDDFEAALGVVDGFLDRIPPSVLNDLKTV